MENRSHKESKEERLKRFQNGPPEEVIETLLNSIDNYFNNEISLTPANYQTSLLFLGVHAVALTVSEAFFGLIGLPGYKKYLEAFVDGEKPDSNFSLIAEELHDWRNILAHQWLGSAGHRVGYDYHMSSGWQRRKEVLFINPQTYCEKNLDAFRAGGKIWDYEEVFSRESLEQTKVRIIEKYLKR